MKADFRCLLSLSTALWIAPSAAFAQTAAQAGQQTQIPQTPAQEPVRPTPTPEATSPAAAVEDQTTAAGVGDVIVTATRRATNLQKVPATIEVASASKLAALNVQDAQGIERLVPGVTVARSGGVTPFIRGIGTFNAGFSEASVAVYIDGVFLPNSAGAIFSFNNIDRIEVLKGPQGTLYGRNVTGGLINVITQQPTDHPTLDASVRFSNFNTVTQNFYGSVPISDNLSANVAVFHENQGRGWSRNLFTGQDTQKAETTGVYTKLQWKPRDGTKITLSGLYNFSNSSRGFAFGIAPGTYGIDGTPYLGEYAISSRVDPNTRTNSYLGALRIDQDLGFAQFFSLTSYQYGRQMSQLSQNGIPGNPVAGQASQDTYIDFNYHTLAEELQLNSSGSGRFNWLVGAFIYHDITKVHTALLPTCVGTVCAPAPGGAPQLVNTRPTTNSVSGYADGTYEILNGTRLTVGLRYTYEKKGFSGLITPYPGRPNSVAVLPAAVILTPQQAGVPLESTYPKLTYRAVLAQDITNRINAYISYNRGFKSGNYNPNSVTNPPVRPEILDAYEVGLKSELFNRKLRLNLSGFYYNYTDIQVRSNAGLPVGAPSIAQNIASAHTNGVDGQFDFAPVRGFTLSGGFEYLDAKYADYPGATCTTPRLPPFPKGVLGGLIATPCNLKGFPLPLSPKWSATLGASYVIDTDAGSITFVANDSYKSRFTFTPDDTVQQRPLHIVDASVTLRTPDKRFDVKLFVTNLTNRYRFQAGQAASTYVYVPGEPRTYGVEVGTHF